MFWILVPILVVAGLFAQIAQAAGGNRNIQMLSFLAGIVAGMLSYVIVIFFRLLRATPEVAVAKEKLPAALSDQDAYHRDVVAWAEGDLSWEEYMRRWAGRVPPSRRRRESFTRKNPDPEIALFKEVMSGAKYERGQYVRRQGTIFYVVEAPPPSALLYELLHDPLTCYEMEDNLELALPRKGEWWEKSRCEKGEHGGDWRNWRTPMQWCIEPNEKPQDDATATEAVSCGCLRPVNFGKGFKGNA